MELRADQGFGVPWLAIPPVSNPAPPRRNARRSDFGAYLGGLCLHLV